MKAFAKLLKLEFNRLLTARYLVAGILFFILSLYFIHNGSRQFLVEMEKKEAFKKSEKAKVEGYLSYDQYGVFGFLVRYIPSPGSVPFNNSGNFQEMVAHINVNEKLNLYGSLKGKDLFMEKTGFYSDFAGLMVLLGSFFLLIYGYETYRPVEYLKTLGSLAGSKKIFPYLIAARFLLISLFFAIVMLAGILWELVEGVPISGENFLYYLLFFLAWEIVAYVLFQIGSSIGKIKNEKTGKSVLFLAWIVFIYILPTAVNKITMESAGNIPENYRLEQEKMDELNKFERRAIAKDGMVKKENLKTKKEMEWIESFWNNEYKKIREIEKKLGKQMAEKIRLYRTLSIFSPTTFINSVENEMSSKGYGNTLEFFRYCQKLKHKFCQYYKKKRSYSDDKKVENFIKDEENLFYAGSRIPSIFLPGVLIMLFYAIVMTIVSYRMYISTLSDIHGKDLKKLEKMDISLKRGKYRVFRTYDNLFPFLLFSVLFGRIKNLIKKGFSGKIKLNGSDLSTGKKSLDFVYIPTDRLFPGEIRIRDFLELIASLVRLPASRFAEILSFPSIQAIIDKKFNQLQNHEWNAVPMALIRMKEAGIYLFFDIAAGMDCKFAMNLINTMDELAKDGALAIYVTTDIADYDEPFEAKNHYLECPDWEMFIKARATEGKKIKHYVRKKQKKETKNEI